MNYNMQKWVEELETTELPQGKQHLRTPEGGFCCLGIACEMFRERSGVESYWVEMGGIGSGLWAFSVGGEQQSGVLPTKVREWLGLAKSDGTAADGSMVNFNSLTNMNDKQDKTFTEIAEHIRENWELLI